MDIFREVKEIYLYGTTFNLSEPDIRKNNNLCF